MEVNFYERMCLYICGILPIILKRVYGQTSGMQGTSTLATDGTTGTGNRNATTYILPTTDVMPDTSTVATDGVAATDNNNVTTHVLSITTMFKDKPNYLFLIGVPLASSIAFFLTLTICICLLIILLDTKKQRQPQVRLNYAWGDHGTDHKTIEDRVIMERNV